MRKIRKAILVFWTVMLVLGIAAIPVQAKTITAKTYSLKNVMKAERPAGKWVTKKNVTRFVRTSGKVIKSRWINYNGKIYYVDASGKRVSTVWVKYRNNLYCVNGKGEVYTGLLKVSGKYFYLYKSTGSLAKGLNRVYGVTYYFNKKTGASMSGWVKIGKYQYYFAPKTYDMVKDSWVRYGGKYFYVDEYGRKKISCWLNRDGSMYYLDSNGARVTGAQYIKGKGYYFDKNGVYDPTVEVKMEVDPDKPMVALTFDDGPGPYTNRLLNCLEKYNAKATFFMVGSSVNNYKNVVRRMASLGCELGNHSYDHPAFTSISASSRRAQITKTSNLIKMAAGNTPTVCRLPYGDGAFSSSVLSCLGLPSIYWSMDTRDWANTGNPQHTVNYVLNNVKDGDIILLHDIHRSSVVAAESIIPALQKRGYQLVTVSQLAKYKGNTPLKAGKTYRGF